MPSHNAPTKISLSQYQSCPSMLLALGVMFSLSRDNYCALTPGKERAVLKELEKNSSFLSALEKKAIDKKCRNAIADTAELVNNCFKDIKISVGVRREEPSKYTKEDWYEEVLRHINQLKKDRLDPSNSEAAKHLETIAVLVPGIIDIYHNAVTKKQSIPPGIFEQLQILAQITVRNKTEKDLRIAYIQNHLNTLEKSASEKNNHSMLRMMIGNAYAFFIGYDKTQNQFVCLQLHKDHRVSYELSCYKDKAELVSMLNSISGPISTVKLGLAGEMPKLAVTASAATSFSSSSQPPTHAQSSSSSQARTDAQSSSSSQPQTSRQPSSIPRDDREHMLFVRTLFGTTFVVYVKYSANFLAIKDYLQPRAFIPVKHQRLVFAGQLLPDADLIAPYRLECHGAIHLIVRVGKELNPSFNKDDYHYVWVINDVTNTDYGQDGPRQQIIFSEDFDTAMASLQRRIAELAKYRSFGLVKLELESASELTLEITNLNQEELHRLTGGKDTIGLYKGGLYFFENRQGLINVAQLPAINHSKYGYTKAYQALITEISALPVANVCKVTTMDDLLTDITTITGNSTNSKRAPYIAYMAINKSQFEKYSKVPALYKEADEKYQPVESGKRMQQLLINPATLVLSQMRPIPEDEEDRKAWKNEFQREKEKHKADNEGIKLVHLLAGLPAGTMFEVQTPGKTIASDDPAYKTAEKQLTTYRDDTQRLEKVFVQALQDECLGAVPLSVLERLLPLFKNLEITSDITLKRDGGMDAVTKHVTANVIDRQHFIHIYNVMVNLGMECGLGDFPSDSSATPLFNNADVLSGTVYAIENRIKDLKIAYAKNEFREKLYMQHLRGKDVSQLKTLSLIFVYLNQDCYLINYKVPEVINNILRNVGIDFHEIQACDFATIFSDGKQWAEQMGFSAVGISSSEFFKIAKDLVTHGLEENANVAPQDLSSLLPPVSSVTPPFPSSGSSSSNSTVVKTEQGSESPANLSVTVPAPKSKFLEAITALVGDDAEAANQFKKYVIGHLGATLNDYFNGFTYYQFTKERLQELYEKFNGPGEKARADELRKTILLTCLEIEGHSSDPSWYSNIRSSYSNVMHIVSNSKYLAECNNPNYNDLLDWISLLPENKFMSSLANDILGGYNEYVRFVNFVHSKIGQEKFNNYVTGKEHYLLKDIEKLRDEFYKSGLDTLTSDMHLSAEENVYCTWIDLFKAVKESDFNLAVSLLNQCSKAVLSLKTTSGDTFVNILLANLVNKTFDDKAQMDQQLYLIKQLINHGADIHNKNRFDTYLLDNIVSYGSLFLISVLGDLGANVKTRSHLIHNVLITQQDRMASASKVDSTKERVEALIKLGADVNTQDTNGQTPLHIAVENKALEVIALLIRHGARLDMKDNQGKEPLEGLAYKDRIEVACRIAEVVEASNESVVLKIKTQALSQAFMNFLGTSRCNFSLIDVANYDKYVTLSINPKELEKMTDANLRDILKQAIASQPSSNPTHLSLILSHEDFFRFGGGARMPEWLFAAVEKEDFNELNELLNLSFAKDILNLPNSDGYTLLHCVAWNNDKSTLDDRIRLVHKLISLGADINSQNRFDNSTPLHRVAEEGQLEMMKTLTGFKNAGIDVNVNANDKDGNTPLHCVFTPYGTEHEKRADMLLNCGAEINIQNQQGQTPLHLAAKLKNFEVIALLIEHDADLFLKDKGNNMPLDCLSHNELFDLVGCYTDDTLPHKLAAYSAHRYTDTDLPADLQKILDDQRKEKEEEQDKSSDLPSSDLSSSSSTPLTSSSSSGAAASGASNSSSPSLETQTYQALYEQKNYVGFIKKLIGELNAKVAANPNGVDDLSTGQKKMYDCLLLLQSAQLKTDSKTLETAWVEQANVSVQNVCHRICGIAKDRLKPSTFSFFRGEDKVAFYQQFQFATTATTSTKQDNAAPSRGANSSQSSTQASTSLYGPSPKLKKREDKDERKGSENSCSYQ